MDFSKIFEIIDYYYNYLKYKILCSSKSREYDVLDGDETVEYTFTRSYKMNRDIIYHPPPNADPNAPPPPSFAAIGANDSTEGLAAPTNGVESC